MNFKMKKIAAAVTVGLGASVVGVNATADEILFPYVAKSATLTTIASVVLRDIGGGAGSEALHYRYYYKPGGSNMDACEELNFRRPTSPNDIQSIDVSDSFAEEGALGVLFNDPSFNNDYLGAGATYAGLSLVADPDDPIRSFLIVDNNDFAGADRGDVAESLYGEAAVVEFQTGAAWGYIAYNSIADQAINAGPEFFGLGRPSGYSYATYSFSNQFETTGEVLKGGTNDIVPTPANPAGPFNPNSMAIFPDDEFVTRLFVTPIADSNDSNGNGFLELAELGNQDNGNITTTIEPIFESTFFGTAVAVDRDENPVSGPASKTVTCVAGINVGTSEGGDPGLFSLGVLNALKATGSDGGGWTNLTLRSPGDTDEAVVMKLEYNRGSTFNGQSYANVFNNTVWLRNGTDKYPAYEQLGIIPVFDVPVPAANAWNYDAAGKSAP